MQERAKLREWLVGKTAHQLASSELGGTPTIDPELDASDEAGFVTRKEQYAVSDLHWFDQAAHRAVGDDCVYCFPGEFIIQQRRICTVRVDRVHTDTVADMGDCGNLRHMTDRSLDRLIGERHAGRAYPQDRGQVDDRARMLLHHVRNYFPHPKEHAGLVECDRLVPTIERNLEQRLSRSKAGIVDENVDPTVLFYDVIDCDLPARLGRHVQIDMLGALGQIIGRLADVAGDDYRALLGKTLHGRLANSARTACNQSNFVLESHCFPPIIIIFSGYTASRRPSLRRSISIDERKVEPKHSPH